MGGTGGEGAMYWMQVLSEIENGETEDGLIVVGDELTGLRESIETVWP